MTRPDRTCALLWLLLAVFARAHAGYRGEVRLIETSGYVVGDFGIERRDGKWRITHIPTGRCFRYSAWPTLRQARKFCQGMMALGRWPKRMSERRFNEACHAVAAEMGIERRKMHALG